MQLQVGVLRRNKTALFSFLRENLKVNYEMQLQVGVFTEK